MGSNDYYALMTLSLLSLNQGNINKLLGTPRIEPGAAGTRSQCANRCAIIVTIFFEILRMFARIQSYLVGAIFLSPAIPVKQDLANLFLYLYIT